MTPTDLATLERAESLLREDAEAEKRACKTDIWEWSCGDCVPGKCPGRESYRVRMEAVAGLRKMIAAFSGSANSTQPARR